MTLQPPISSLGIDLAECTGVNVEIGICGCRMVEYTADAGLLSPEFAAGIRRVKGAKKLGIRLGNWLSANEARALWQSPNAETLKGKRDRAMIAVLLGCGLRRRE